MTTATNPKDLEDLLAQTQLPALPQSAMRLLELSRDPENGPEEFAAPIEADLGLASQVLRFVNSSYFGFSGEISSVKLAITLVGIRTVKNFALWNAVFTLMPNPKCGDLDLKSLWKDSLRRAIFARSLAKKLQLKDREDVFSAALLQDMAVPLLAKEIPNDYRELLELREGGKVRLSVLEQERFGWTHADASVFLAKHWKLPDRFMTLLSAHLELEKWADQSSDHRDAFAISLSSHLPADADAQWFDREIFESAYRSASGLPDVVDLLARVDTEFQEFAPIMQLSISTKSLVDHWNQQAAPAVS